MKMKSWRMWYSQEEEEGKKDVKGRRGFLLGGKEGGQYQILALTDWAAW